MAKTYQNQSTLKRAVWAKNLFVDAMATIYFVKNKLMGKDPNNAVLVQDDLEKERGDRVHFKLTQKLVGRGTRGGGELEGNEERMVFWSESVLIDQIRHAVRLEGVLDEQEDAYDKRTDAKDLLKTWIAEFVERQIFLKASGVTNANLVDINGDRYSDDYDWSNTPDFIPNADETAGTGSRYLAAAAAGSITTSDLITPALISKIRVKAETAKPKILPLKIDGEEKYLLFVHPWVAYDLKRNAEFAQAQREALPRSSDHPLFKSGQMVGEWDGVLVIKHDFVPFLDISALGSGAKNFRGGGSATDWITDTFRCLLFGQQGVGYAKAKNLNKEWVEKTFDYDDEYGVATSLLGGIQKIVFNGKEYGVMALDVYATHFA